MRAGPWAIASDWPASISSATISAATSTAAFPALEFTAQDLTIRDDCLGPGYARFTDPGATAAELVHRETGIVLNGAYTANAFAAVLADADRGVLQGKTVLFWNTYNSRDLSALTAQADYRQLPQAFHRYFEEEVQPLDRAGLDL